MKENRLFNSIIPFTIGLIVGLLTLTIRPIYDLISIRIHSKNITDSSDMNSKDGLFTSDGFTLAPLSLPTLQDNESTNLLQTIRELSPRITAFPIDLILDEKQMDVDFIREECKFKASSFIRARVTKEEFQDTFYNYSRTPYLRCDSTTDEYRIVDYDNDFIRLKDDIERRYDLTYDRFVPFYQFYLSALNAKARDIEECFDAFDTLSPKEKALAFTALYVFEQCSRKRKRTTNESNIGEKFKYDEYRVEAPFSEEKWSSLISLLNEYAKSQETAFEAIPNDGLVEEWERSFRINALLFQASLSYYNPYFIPLANVSIYWASVCRLAPIDFLYALLLTETDIDNLNSDSGFIRRNAVMESPDLTTIVRQWQSVALRRTGSDIPTDNVMSDQIESTTSAESESNIIFKDSFSNWKNDYSPSTEYCVLYMKEYLKTQYTFSRRFCINRRASLRSVWEYETHESITRSYYETNANTSIEPKTLGFIASALLHSRSLFEGDMR